MDRIPASIEAAAFIRRAEADGGFAAILRKGDADRGALTLILRRRGELFGVLERAMGADFLYRWTLTEPAGSLDAGSLDRLIASRTRLDRDLWLIELDVADPERFIAETIALG